MRGAGGDVISGAPFGWCVYVCGPLRVRADACARAGVRPGARARANAWSSGSGLALLPAGHALGRGRGPQGHRGGALGARDVVAHRHGLAAVDAWVGNRHVEAVVG